MTTTLDPSFLRAIVLLTGFKLKPMLAAQSAMLLIGLRGVEFRATDIPADITRGSKHLAGAACGALLTQGLIEVVRREKSPDPKAKGRRLDVYRIPASKFTTVRTWLAGNGVDADQLPREGMLL